jgi:hypothetical protein
MHFLIALSTTVLASQAPAFSDVRPVTAGLESQEAAPWQPKSNLGPNPLKDWLTPYQLRDRRSAMAVSLGATVLGGGLMLMLPVVANDPSDMGLMLGLSSVVTFGVWLPMTVLAAGTSAVTHRQAQNAGLELHPGWLIGGAAALVCGTALLAWGDETSTDMRYIAGAVLFTAAPAVLILDHHQVRRQARQLSWGLSPMKQGAMAGLTLRL